MELSLFELSERNEIWDMAEVKWGSTIEINYVSLKTTVYEYLIIARIYTKMWKVQNSINNENSPFRHPVGTTEVLNHYETTMKLSFRRKNDARNIELQKEKLPPRNN